MRKSGQRRNLSLYGMISLLLLCIQIFGCCSGAAAAGGGLGMNFSNNHATTKKRMSAPSSPSSVKTSTTSSLSAIMTTINHYSLFSFRKTQPPPSPSPQMNFFHSMIEETTRILSQPLPKYVVQSLYWLTAADSVQHVFMNDYKKRTVPFTGGTSKQKSGGVAVPPVIYFFARVRPRLLFSVGSLLRALQLTTPLQRIFDPSIGVGAGINIAAMIAGSRWVKPLILGWTITRTIWIWLGARQPENIHVPIVLSLERPKKEK